MRVKQTQDCMKHAKSWKSHVSSGRVARMKELKALKTLARIGNSKLTCKVLRDCRKQATSAARMAPLPFMFTMSLSIQQQSMAHRAFMNMFVMSLPATTERKKRYRTVKLLAL